MSSSEVLLKAAFKCLALRLDNGMAGLRENMAYLLKDGPEKLRQEVQLFYEEVIDEASRIEKETDKKNSKEDEFSSIINEANDPQIIIDHLREKVSYLSRKIEERS